MLITSHIRADGDSLGAMTAAYEFLNERGIEAAMRYDGEIPQSYRFLAHIEKINEARAFSPAAALVLDSPTLDRVGKAAEAIAPNTPVINIDHHPDNSFFGALNLVREDASSSCEVLYDVFRACGGPLNVRTAVSLYTGVLTDTGRFSHPNATARAFAVCAELGSTGIDFAEVSSQVYKSLPVNVFRLQAKAMQRLRLALDGRVACITVPREVFVETGTQPIDTQDFADIPRLIRGVEVGVFIREESEQNDIKVSLRSRPGIDIRAVARKFGGGGHRQAAGCSLRCELSQAEELVLTAVVEHLKKETAARP